MRPKTKKKLKALAGMAKEVNGHFRIHLGWLDSEFRNQHKTLRGWTPEFSTVEKGELCKFGYSNHGIVYKQLSMNCGKSKEYVGPILDAPWSVQLVALQNMHIFRAAIAAQ